LPKRPGFVKVESSLGESQVGGIVQISSTPRLPVDEQNRFAHLTHALMIADSA
jgi:hypothetical protein